jgi:hypothetical protein
MPKFKKCPVGTEIQTLIFSKDHFSEAQAKAWAKEHDEKYGYIDEKENTYRIRQQEPSEFVDGSMKTIHLTEGVQAVIGCPKEKMGKGGVFDGKILCEMPDGLIEEESILWDTLNIESGTDLEEDEENQKEYIKEVTKIAKEAIGDSRLSERVYEDLESDNNHTLNQALELLGYYGDEYKKHRIEFYKKNGLGLNPKYFGIDIDKYECGGCMATGGGVGEDKKYPVWLLDGKYKDAYSLHKNETQSKQLLREYGIIPSDEEIIEVVTGALDLSGGNKYRVITDKHWHIVDLSMDVNRYYNEMLEEEKAENKMATGGVLEDKEVDEDRYDWMLGVMPPIYITSIDGEKIQSGFAMSEPNSHVKVEGGYKATFTALYKKDGKYFEVPDVYFEGKGEAKRVNQDNKAQYARGGNVADDKGKKALKALYDITNNPDPELSKEAIEEHLAKMRHKRAGETKNFSVGDNVWFKDTYGDYTQRGKVEKIREEDGITLYDVSGGKYIASYMADEIIPIREHGGYMQSGGSVAKKYVSIAPSNTMFVRINSHRASDKANRTGIAYITFWHLYAKGNAAQDVWLINESDYDKIKNIKGVSSPLYKLTTEGSIYNPRLPLEGEEKQKYDPYTSLSENRKLYDAYYKINKDTMAKGGSVGKPFLYVVDKDERGEFSFHVEDTEGNEVYEYVFDGSDEDQVSIFEDGFMNHTEDIVGLTKYMKDLGIIGEDDYITDDEQEIEEYKEESMAEGGIVNTYDLSTLHSMNRSQLEEAYKEKFGSTSRMHDYNTYVAALYYNKRIKEVTPEDIDSIRGLHANPVRYVAVGETKDGYWVVVSKPTTKEVAESHLDSLPESETGKVVTLAEALAHKKVLGIEYLKMADGGCAGCGQYAKGGKVGYHNPPMNKKVYATLLEEAKEDKKWAEKTKKDKEWLANASTVSKEMLQERLNKSEDELAMDAYKYLYMRAHAKGNVYGVEQPIDRAALRKWEELGGQKVK